MSRLRLPTGIAALAGRLEAIPFPGVNQPRKALTWALAVSLLLHAILLAIRFTDAKRNTIHKSSNLEVVLVNSKSANRPKDAQVLAQANLDAGGNVDENRVAATPLPATRRDKTGDTLLQKQKKMQELEAKQRQLLAMTRQEAPLAPPPNAQKVLQPDTVSKVSGADLADSALAMARLEAKIAREVDAYNKRPRVNHFGTRAASAVEAQYVEDWRQKVERVGNLNYPDAARGKMYGTLVLTVQIGADGELKDVVVTRPSGHKVLDEAARRIVRLASPYAPFPTDLKRSFDILEITRTWSFTKGDTLQSN